MALRYPQTIPGLGGIYQTNTNSYRTIEITAVRPVFEPSCLRDAIELIPRAHKLGLPVE